MEAIKWVKVGTFKELFMSENSFDKSKWWCTGLYIHILEIGGKQYIDYIGKVNRGNLIERQLEHYRNLCCGICFMKKEVMNIVPVQNVWKKDCNWIGGVEKNKEGKYLKPQDSNYLDVILDQQKFMKMASFFFEYANMIKIYLADRSSNRDEIKELEKQ